MQTTHSCVYNDYYKAIQREESSHVIHDSSDVYQQLPTTSRASPRPTYIQPLVTITTPNGEHQRQIPRKSDFEIVMRTPFDLNGETNGYQFYSRLISDCEKSQIPLDENEFNIEMVKDLRWIHWRMTLFVFYWIVWFIGLILVIIIVAYRARN